jgi:thiamine phosphate synthase YjbQ (UPF0047 family)
VKSLTRYLKMHTPERMEFVNITPRSRIGGCGGEDSPPHGGAHWAPDRTCQRSRTASRAPGPRDGEDNGDAHHKRQVMGREVVVAVTRGKLDFGPWEQIFYGEFDGRRDKRVLIKIIGE